VTVISGPLIELDGLPDADIDGAIEGAIEVAIEGATDAPWEADIEADVEGDAPTPVVAPRLGLFDPVMPELDKAELEPGELAPGDEPLPPAHAAAATASTKLATRIVNRCMTLL